MKYSAINCLVLVIGLSINMYGQSHYQGKLKLGHILSGLALLYAGTGEKMYKIKADSLVGGLVDVQKVLNQKGY